MSTFDQVNLEGWSQSNIGHMTSQTVIIMFCQAYVNNLSTGCLDTRLQRIWLNENSVSV
jgi:hypothetical protein